MPYRIVERISPRSYRKSEKRRRAKPVRYVSDNRRKQAIPTRFEYINDDEFYVTEDDSESDQLELAEIYYVDTNENAGKRSQKYRYDRGRYLASEIRPDYGRYRIPENKRVTYVRRRPERLHSQELYVSGHRELNKYGRKNEAEYHIPENKEMFYKRESPLCSAEYYEIACRKIPPSTEKITTRNLPTPPQEHDSHEAGKEKIIRYYSAENFISGNDDVAMNSEKDGRILSVQSYQPVAQNNLSREASVTCAETFESSSSSTKRSVAPNEKFDKLNRSSGSGSFEVITNNSFKKHFTKSPTISSASDLSRLIAARGEYEGTEAIYQTVTRTRSSTMKHPRNTKDQQIRNNFTKTDGTTKENAGNAEYDSSSRMSFKETLTTDPIKADKVNDNSTIISSTAEESDSSYSEYEKPIKDAFLLPLKVEEIPDVDDQESESKRKWRKVIKETIKAQTKPGGFFSYKDASDKWEDRDDAQKEEILNRRTPTIQEWMADADNVRQRQSMATLNSPQANDDDSGASVDFGKRKQSNIIVPATSESDLPSSCLNVSAKNGNRVTPRRSVSFQHDGELKDFADGKASTGSCNLREFLNNRGKCREDDNRQDECDYGRWIKGLGRKETWKEMKDRILGRTVYLTPTYADTQVQHFDEINLDKFDKIDNCRPSFISMSFDNTFERMTDAEIVELFSQAQDLDEKEVDDIARGGVSCKLFCDNCDQYELESCDGDHEEDGQIYSKW